MTTTQTPDNAVLALSPPRAPEATEPVVGAHYGVPKHVYDLKPMGLTIAVDPPLAGTVQAGDVIRLMLNGASTEATKTIQTGEENEVQTLYLPKGLLLPNQLNTLVYTITRASQNIGTSTPELTLLYNAIRPGIEDRTPGDGAHSELQLILPQDVIEDGIDAERAEQGVQVCFAYPYCRAYDVIRLNCNGQDVERTVTAAEAPTTPSAEPTTVCVMVGKDVFQQAGDNPKFVFSYTVTDQLGNGPDTDSPYSGAVEVDVHLTETRLVAPDLAEDPDDPSDDPSTIDLAKLGSKDLTVLVHAFAPLWQPNDKIRVIYTASKLDTPVESHTVEADVGRIPFTYKLKVPNAKVIAGSVVRAKYELVRGGITIATSKTTTADAIDGSTIVLLPPFLVAPAVDPIDVLAYPNGVTVRIEYLGALKGDRARLVEVNAPAGSPQFPLVEFNANKRVNTLLSPAFLAARHGKVIELRWNLNRNGGRAGQSESVKLNVSKIIDGDERLPSPRVSQAPDNKVLDLRTFEGAAEITVIPWIGISTENFVNLKIAGKDNNDDNCVIPILTDHNITETEKASGLKESVSRENLLTLKHDTKFEILFEALPSATTNSTPIIFPTLNLNLLNDPLIVMEDFETGTDGNKPVGTVMDFPSMTVTVVAGNSSIATSSIFAPYLISKYIYIYHNSTLRFTLKNTARSIRFGIASISRVQTTYTCYDENLQLIKSHLTPPYEVPDQVWAEITETPNRKIKYIDLTNGRYGCSVDNFSIIN
ncbi:hypothetical protein J2Y39_000587 [Pseudomonas sp. 2957]|uniref:hypothetical protein n=1 Tax=Pseudomonas sp. 2957 TaxID=2817766 RepID=UPI00285AE752|nr:hypothetical protein [Pseudomonas sp. 2957]MDR6946007.1 hypothetical protein [Pseudomonas sp. 2957]